MIIWRIFSTFSWICFFVKNVFFFFCIFFRIFSQQQAEKQRISGFPRFRCGSPLSAIKWTKMSSSATKTWPKGKLVIHAYIAPSTCSQSIGRNKNSNNASWLHEFAGTTRWCSFYNLQKTTLLFSEQPILSIGHIQRAEPSKVGQISLSLAQTIENDILLKFIQQMQRLNAFGNVFVTRRWSALELFAKISEHCQRSDRWSIVFHVQFITERRLEQNKKILSFIAW